MGALGHCGERSVLKPDNIGKNPSRFCFKAEEAQQLAKTCYRISTAKTSPENVKGFGMTETRPVESCNRRRPHNETDMEAF